MESVLNKKKLLSNSATLSIFIPIYVCNVRIKLLGCKICSWNEQTCAKEETEKLWNSIKDSRQNE